MAKIECIVGKAWDGTGAVDFMCGVVEAEDGLIELYAEAPASDNGESFDVLRREILEQADEEGIDVTSLVFFYE